MINFQEISRFIAIEQGLESNPKIRDFAARFRWNTGHTLTPSSRATQFFVPNLSSRQSDKVLCSHEADWGRRKGKVKNFGAPPFQYF
jgi:hypothetical protein